MPFAFYRKQILNLDLVGWEAEEDWVVNFSTIRLSVQKGKRLEGEL